jgi:hypothetical protein
MLRGVVRLLGVDLDRKLSEVRAQLEEFRARATGQLTEQIKQTSLTVGFALVGGIAAVATFIIILVALYRWVDMYGGPFAALGAVGAVMAILAAVMFALAFGRQSHKPAGVAVDRPRAAVRPSPSPLSEAAPIVPSAALSPLPPNAPLLDVLSHRISTRVAGASDEAIDAVAHIMRIGSKSALFGTLAVVALLGIFLGRRR